MAKVLLMLFIFSLILLATAQYDFFQMVQQWPPAKCSSIRVRCHATPPTMFTIHGLWPSNYSNVFLHRCSNASLQPRTQLATLLPRLNKYWPDVVYGRNDAFWKHEWNKHGTCSNPPFNKFQYFQKTLNIGTDQNYDLLAILNAAKLGPTARTIGQYQAIEGAIEAATGKKPGLHCNTNAGTGRSQLFEIILCFDEHAVTLIDCPQFVSTCPSTFMWFSHQD